MTPEANSATPLDACPKSESACLRRGGMLTLHRTRANASKGAHTIGCLAVSKSFSAKALWGLECDIDATDVVPSPRPRIVTGTTTRLMTREAIAIETALALPNRSPRMAVPINGAAGADAVKAASTL